MTADDWKIIEKQLGSLEVKIMRVLWDEPGLPVRTVVTRLPGRRRRAYTTVMTVMNRLFEKGLLSREPMGRAFVYSPALSQKRFVESVARASIRALISDYGETAVSHFVGELKELGPDEFERLRRLINEADQ